MTPSPSKPSNKPASPSSYQSAQALIVPLDKKAREDMIKLAGKKGPMNSGQQGIKKSGKK